MKYFVLFLLLFLAGCTTAQRIEYSPSMITSPNEATRIIADAVNHADYKRYWEVVYSTPSFIELHSLIDRETGHKYVFYADLFEVTLHEKNGVYIVTLLNRDGDTAFRFWTGVKRDAFGFVDAANTLKDKNSKFLSLTNKDKRFDFRFFPDGSGYFDQSSNMGINGKHWMFSISRDPMTDALTATAFKMGHIKTGRWSDYDAEVGLYISAINGVKSICVMGHNFPGRHGTIRIGNQAPFETADGACLYPADVPAVRKLLLDANVVNVRGYRWPYDVPITAEVKIKGYNVLEGYLAWASLL